MRIYMGWVLGAAFVLIGLALFRDGTSTGDPMPTERPQSALAPDFSLPNLAGQSVRLSDYDGQIRIVDFWATWCPPCKAEIPHFNAITRDYSELGVVVIGISLDQGGVDSITRFLEQTPIDYPILLGNAQVLNAFGGIQSIPTTYVIDQQGHIYRKYVGYRPQEAFEADIRNLLQRDHRS